MSKWISELDLRHAEQTINVLISHCKSHGGVCVMDCGYGEVLLTEEISISWFMPLPEPSEEES